MPTIDEIATHRALQQQARDVARIADAVEILALDAAVSHTPGMSPEREASRKRFKEFRDKIGERR